MEEKQYVEFRCPQCSALLYKYVDTEEPYAGEAKCLKRGCGSVAIRANCVPANLVELRCQHIDERKSEKWGSPTVCNKLLAKIIPGSDVETKCPRCKKLTYSLDLFPMLLPEETYEKDE